MRRDVSLFPYAVARVAGGPLSELSQINLRQTPLLLKKFETTQAELDKIKEKISDDLHTFIATVTESNIRFALIQLRRDVHNEKFDTFLSPQLAAILPKTLTFSLNHYLQLIKHKKQLLVNAHSSFQKEKIHSKKIFLKLLTAKNFQNGILLSSSTLPESLQKYLAEKEKPLPKIERSLMKYLSRMYTKPSPFSTFTSLTLATFSENIPNAKKKSQTSKSHIALNHYLFQYLFGLLAQNEKLRKYLPISLNSTIQLQDDQFFFLANNFNRESIQRINRTPALEFIYHFMQKKRNWQYNTFVNQLHAKQFKTISIEEIETYVTSLLSYGFVEYDLGISGVDRNWDKKFSQFVKPLLIHFPYLAELDATLKYLRSAAKLYETASPQKRKQLLTAAYTKLRETCLQLHSAADLPLEERASFAPKFIPKEEKKKRKSKKDNEIFTYEYTTAFSPKPHNLWYEDTTISPSLPLGSKVAKNLQIFGNLLSKMGWFDTCTEKSYVLTDFFTSHYQLTDHVDLLQFYEDYYREEREKKKKKGQSSPSLEAMHTRNKHYLDTFIEKIKDRVNTHDVVNITQQDVAFIPYSNTPSSFGAFFQFMSNPHDEPIIVVNSTVPGWGKLYSRFLPLFPQETTTKLRALNKKYDKTALLAELTDASIFNANLHPPLMPFEITAPGSYTRLAKKQQIPITDIKIVYKKTDKRIHLIHKHTQKEIFAFDLGFQGESGRSELLGFLASFSLGGHHHTTRLTQRINQKIKHKNKQIIVLPRITYENCIVLQRKTWNIAKDAMPTRLPQENDWEYYKKIVMWRKEIGLPDEIFITVAKDKPQYIHFTNPFLIILLEKTIEKMKKKDRLRIEEMLPNAKDVILYDNQQTVKEFFVQWFYN